MCIGITGLLRCHLSLIFLLIQLRGKEDSIILALINDVSEIEVKGLCVENISITGWN